MKGNDKSTTLKRILHRLIWCFMIGLFKITDPDPDPENFQGMHYDFLKKANSKALIDCLTLSQLHTLKGLLIDQQLPSSTHLEKCLMPQC